MVNRKYDTMLYGNGLTINIMANVMKIISPSLHKYCDINLYFKHFIRLETHKVEFRNFVKIFNSNKKYLYAHIEAMEYLKKNENEILNLGFERYVSKYLFSEEYDQIKLHKEWIYALYNYWFCMFIKNVCYIPCVKEYLNNISNYIGSLITKNIYTLNFDLIIDDNLQIDHLHGKFLVLFNTFQDIILFEYNNNKRFEYKYLLGTNGIEKFSRLSRIKKYNQNDYDLDFLFDNEIELGHILIYGVSFEQSECIPEEIKNNYKDFYLVNSVDGHILTRLYSLKQSKKLREITVAYYSDKDLNNYKKLFKYVNLLDITNFIQSVEIY